ncbi:MAG: SsrA-binding protein [Bacteroidales bacterium OttesenSCG-928-I14]|jgi:SsrA-binding protein|nr:SsrA-binding protein [Bacteroidales bacterium OttesenSCG-928-I14]
MTINNKKASFNYEFIEIFVAGIVLSGTEIKSIRLGKAVLIDSYCLFIKNELWVRNMYISEYIYGTYNNHEVRKDRKLLLNRRELKKIERIIKIKGVSVIPTKLFFNENGLAKLCIATAKGKKKYDKKQSLKEKDIKREIDIELKKK